MRTTKFFVATLFVASLVFSGANNAIAAVTVTAATGGTNTSADKAANATAPAYTTLGNVVITENANTDFAASQTNRTLILTAPSGWTFNAGVGTVSFTSNKDITAASIAVTTSVITVTLSTDSNANRADILTISGIQVRATNGASLPSSGSILRTVANPGTATISGITNGSTNFGSLSQVTGNATKLVFSTQPTGATYGSNLGTQPVVKSQDQFNNNSATGLGASKTVTLTLSSGTGTLSGTVALDIGTGAGNGTVTYSGLSITGVGAAGSGKALTAAATGLTSGTSSTFTINQLAAVLTGTRVYDTTTTAAFDILSVSNKVGADNVIVASGSGTLASANAGAEAISSLGTLALGGTTAGNYTLTGASGTVTVSKATPTLSVTNSPSAYTGSAQSAAVSCQGGGAASNISTGGGATQTNAGTYAVTADCAVSTNYNAVTGGSAGNFVITPVNQTIIFNALSNKTMGDPDFAVSATATSGLTVSFTSLTASVCTVSTAIVHLAAAGTCTIEASQVGDGNYNAATPVDQSFTVAIAKTDPILSVTNSPVAYNGSAQSATVTGSVPGIVSNVKYAGSSTAPTNAGTYAITADFAPTDTTHYNSLTGASAGNFVINKADQTITFSALSDKTLGDVDFLVSATASSGLTVSFTSQTTGVCTVSTATVHLVAIGTCTIRASQSGNSNYNAASNADQSFTVHQAATKFVIVPPSSGVVGSPTTVTVQAEKADNSIDINYQTGVTLNTTGSATGGGLVTITNGVGTMNISDTHAETVNLSLTDSQTTGLDVSSTQTLVFAAGAVSSFSLSNPGDMYAKTRLGYTVTRYDSFGNAVGAGTTRVYIYTTSTSTSAKFYDDSLAGSAITFIDIAAGHSTANFWYYDEAPGAYTITVSDATPNANGATGIADATDSVTVNPVATKFVIVPPTNGTVDAPIAITVQALKPDNSIDTNYQNDVTLNTTGSATGGGLIDIINGVGTKNISDTVAETVNFSLTDSQTTTLDVSSTQSAVFAGGVISQFVLSHPGTGTAGVRTAYTITREDQYGNASSQATSTIYMYSSSTGANKKFYDAATAGNIITSLDIPDGQSTASVWYYDEKPDTWSITASDNASNPDGNTGINDGVDSLVMTAGPSAAFFLNNPGDMTAGTRLAYTVTRKDSFNNLVTIGATTVYMYSNSIGTSSPAFYDAATAGNTVTSFAIPDGQSLASVWYLDPNPGAWTVTASDSTPSADGAAGIIDATDPVNVSAAPIVATRYVIVPPTSGTTDASIPITVKAEDSNGNVDTTIQVGVTLRTDGSATGAGLVAFSNGVGTISISDATAETVHLSLSDSQNTTLDVSSTQSVTFAPGAVAQFSLDNPGDVAAGTRIGYTVTRKDLHGNAVTVGATTVYLYNSSTGINKKFFDAANGGSAITSIVIPDGSSSIGFWAYDEKAGNWFITASDNPTAADGASGIADASDAIAVQPAAVAKFLLNDPGNMTAGTRLGYTVTRKDQFDNLVTSGVTLAYLYSSSTGTTTAFYATSIGGAVTTFATINDGSSSGDFWYYDNTPGTWNVTASDSASGANGAAGVADAVDSVSVSAIPIVATRFVILPVTSVQVGVSATVTVEAQDDTGNIDTTIQSGVTLETTGSATGAGLVSMVNGVGTMTLRDTQAETVTLSLSDSQHTNLDVSSTQSLVFSATPVSPSRGGSSGVRVIVPVPVIVGVRLTGVTFPNANVQVLAVSQEGAALQGKVTSSANGSFSLLLKNIDVGAGAYGVVAVDALGRSTQTKVFNANYASKNTLLTLDPMLLSPTLGLVHPTVRQNDVVGFVGFAAPRYTIEVQIDGKDIQTNTEAGSDGSYKVLVPTGTMAFGSHTVRVRQISPAGARSEYAPQKIFTITALFTPQTDFNQDGVINVQDWSIFLSRWGSTVPAVHMLNDLNGDGKVDVTDLSIFVRTLKK